MKWSCLTWQETLEEGTALDVAVADENRDSVLASVADGELHHGHVGLARVCPTQLCQSGYATVALCNLHEQVVSVADGVGLAVTLVKLQLVKTCKT